MQHDTESGQRSSARHDLPGDPNPPGSTPDNGVTEQAGARRGAEPSETAEPSAPSEPSELAEAAETTGDPRVDAALRGLARLDDASVTEHPQVFESIHGALAEVLGELRPGAGGADEPRAGD